MPPTRIVECQCPYNMDNYTEFVESDRLFVTRMSVTRRFNLVAQQQQRLDNRNLRFGGSYLLVFNRMTNAWVNPLPLPEPYERRACRPIGIAHDRTVVAVCDESQTHFRLGFFRLSQKLDAVVVVRTILLSPNRQPFRDCIGFFSSANNFLQIVGISADLSGFLYDHASTTTTPIELPLPISRFEHAMMYAGRLYLICADALRCRKLYAYDDDKLQFVTDCPFGSSRTCDVRMTHRGSRLLLSFWDEFFSSAEVFIFDLSTRRWTTTGRAAFAGKIVPHSSCITRSVRGDGEILLNSNPWSMQAHNGRYVLYSMWLLPPKMGRLALRAVHRCLPKYTQEVLEAEEATIRSVEELITFLCGHNTIRAWLLLGVQPQPQARRRRILY